MQKAREGQGNIVLILRLLFGIINMFVSIWNYYSNKGAWLFGEGDGIDEDR